MTSVPTEPASDKTARHERVNTSLRDARIAECWAPVPQYRADEDQTEARARRAALATFFGDQPTQQHDGHRVRWSGAA